MRDIFLFITAQTGSILVLTGPILIYLDVELWAIPMFTGMIILVLTSICHNLWRD